MKYLFPLLALVFVCGLLFAGNLNPVFADWVYYCETVSWTNYGVTNVNNCYYRGNGCFDCDSCTQTSWPGETECWRWWTQQCSDVQINYTWFNSKCYGTNYCIENQRITQTCNGPGPSCTCTEWIPQASCGNGCATTQERFYTRTCTPGGCDTESSCFTAAECACDPNAWGSCSAACGSGTETNECGGTRSCCSECGPSYGAWGSCSGSPATKSQTVSYSCQASTTETASCYGTIRARAVVVTAADTSCTAVRASTTGISGMIHQFTPGSASQPAPQTQSGASYVTFSNVAGGTYTISPTLPATDYVLTSACWSRTLNAPTSGEGFSASLSVPTDGETLTWDIGYTQGTPWVQTGGGGNVSAETSITSAIPIGTSPRAFALDGTGGYAGVVSYGTSYDFDSSVTSTGEGNVSSADWLVTQSMPSINYYELFWRRFGGGTAPDSFPDLGAVTKPASRTTPYYVAGDMTTSGNWTVTNGETIIFLVNGNLTLGGKVNIVGTGFAAFIVSGNITVDSSVGGPPASDNPVIEGVYVTSPTGTFKTGTSGTNKERFVGQGIFVAGSFLLQRDLDSVDANPTTAAELFLYNPRLLFTMPDSMRDVPITWEEVAP